MTINHLPKLTQSEPISLRAFAERVGITRHKLEQYCKQGRLIGARKHPLTKHWWIYPPAKLVLSSNRF